MDVTVWGYFVYLAISVGVTIWVARTLHKAGSVFLVDSFRGNTELAASVNQLLVVGFYLINLGYVSLALKYGDKARDFAGAIEVTSTKLGLVLLSLGVMHFFNLYVFSRIRRRALIENEQPPVRPDSYLSHVDHAGAVERAIPVASRVT
jgi:hypothetical protein